MEKRRPRGLRFVWDITANKAKRHSLFRRFLCLPKSAAGGIEKHADGQPEGAYGPDGRPSQVRFLSEEECEQRQRNPHHRKTGRHRKNADENADAGQRQSRLRFRGRVIRSGGTTQVATARIPAPISIARPEKGTKI